MPVDKEYASGLTNTSTCNSALKCLGAQGFQEVFAFFWGGGDGVHLGGGGTLLKIIIYI